MDFPTFFGHQLSRLYSLYECMFLKFGLESARISTRSCAVSLGYRFGHKNSNDQESLHNWKRHRRNCDIFIGFILFPVHPF